MSQCRAADSFDLDGYLARIEYTGERHCSAAVLSALHLAHAMHIPFENLDVLLGCGVRLDLGSLQEKLVTARRGGYCFEQNLLFAAALGALGFTVTPLAARVRLGAQHVLPRTHMLLAVRVDNGDWLADVGFGAQGLLLPIPFVVGDSVRHLSWTYRVVEEGSQWVLQSWRDSAWLDLYVFTLEPQQLVDYELANYYISTHPSSPFTQSIIVQFYTPDARLTLRGREFVIDHGDSVSTRQLQSDDELLEVLATSFGLPFPAGTRFRGTATDSS